ncbi:MAG: MaoC family dehydratase [Deltaproteobacteria bacterium]|nr:MaoC family dehydratase [Deltaproteobacteria bacterium]
MALSVGQKATRCTEVTPELVRRFADVCGDFNPVHLDATFAATTPFGRPIAHGMLGASLISGLLGSEFPGPGTIYFEQSLKFSKPVFVGDTVTTTAEVVWVRDDKPIARLRTVVTNGQGEVAVEGEAVVRFV